MTIFGNLVLYKSSPSIVYAVKGKMFQRFKIQSHSGCKKDEI